MGVSHGVFFIPIFFLSTQFRPLINRRAMFCIWFHFLLEICVNEVEQFRFRGGLDNTIT